MSIAAEVDGEVVAGVVVNVATGVEYVAPPAAGRCVAPATARRSRCATRRRWRQRLVAHRLRLPGRGARRPGRRAWPGCCRTSATSGGWARAPSTCATWPRAALDGYVEEGVNLWDHAAGALIATRPGPVRAARRERRRRRRMAPAVGHRGRSGGRSGTSFLDAAHGVPDSCTRSGNRAAPAAVAGVTRREPVCDPRGRWCTIWRRRHRRSAAATAASPASTGEWRDDGD